ncbi:unnamed protein product [Aphanomyces euteiches]
MRSSSNKTFKSSTPVRQKLGSFHDAAFRAIELESFFGPLLVKPDADDEERRPEPQITPFTPTVKFELPNRDNTRERIIEQKFTGAAAPQVLILNGPCALVNDFVSG